MAQLIAGVDVGGTKIVAGLATRRGRVVAIARAATPGPGDDAVVAAIIALLRQAMSDAGVAVGSVSSVGIAVPAVIDSTAGEVLWAPNIPGWQTRVSVARPVGEALGAHASLHYDGHAWVVGEWWLGAARGARNVALMAVGTGIGGGIILDGRLHRGRLGVAGAIGWWIPDFRQLSRERRHPQGLLESIAAGPAIARAAAKGTAQEAFEAARSGDGCAARAVEKAAAALGAAAANLVSLLDPEVVVLAGGVIAGGGDLILPRVQEIVANEAQPQLAPGVRIVAAALGDDAPWLGAARLGLSPGPGKPAACLDMKG